MSTDLAVRIAAARRAVLTAVLAHAEPLVVVDSPPGAGKTGLVQDVAALAADHGMRVVVATKTAEQGFDFARRVRRDTSATPLQLFVSERRPAPVDLAAGWPPGREPVHRPGDLAGGPLVTVTTTAKLELAVPQLAGTFDLLIIDEAYQLTWAELAPLAHLAGQILLVGDPGQLPPIVTVDIAMFEAAAVKVHWPAPAEVLRAHPEATTYQLPATRRLPADTTDFVAPTFYPQLPFRSAAPEQALRFSAAGLGGPIDDALDAVASGASLVVLTLPRLVAEHDPTDPELAAVAAALASRALERGAFRHDPTGATPPRPLIGADIGLADQHVASGAEMRRQTRAAGLGADTMIATPEIWQGLERPLMIVKHPLSGAVDMGEFSLSPGRLCVMTSRHLLGCIVVTRDGVGEDLEVYVHDSSTRPSGARDETYEGYRAHRFLWQELESRGRILRHTSGFPVIA